MSDMTLLEALQTDQVKGVIRGQIQEAVSEALDGDALKTAVTDVVGDVVKDALTEQLPTLRESLRDEVRTEIAQDGQLEVLAGEAKRLLEASPLKGAALQNLLDDYALVEADGETKPARGLALIEAVTDAEGKVTKSAKDVLRESVDTDIKRVRNVLRESAPSLPFAPGGTSDVPDEGAERAFLGEDSAFAKRLKDRGMDPADFGATPTPTT